MKKIYKSLRKFLAKNIIVDALVLHYKKIIGREDRITVNFNDDPKVIQKAFIDAGYTFKVPFVIGTKDESGNMVYTYVDCDGNPLEESKSKSGAALIMMG